MMPTLHRGLPAAMWGRPHELSGNESWRSLGTEKGRSGLGTEISPTSAC